MRYSILLLAAMLTGGSTVVPVAVKFPDAPGVQANTPCPDLKQLKDTAKLSDVGKTVAINYSTYYECVVKTDAWIEWYKIQKRIFENVK